MAAAMSLCSPYLRGIVKAVVQAAQPRESTWSYFSRPSEGQWRGSATHEGAALLARLSTLGAPSVLEQATKVLSEVNRNFRTRQRDDDLGYIARESLRVLTGAGPLPGILEATDAERRHIAQVYVDALKACRPPALAKTPFALLSKWYHTLQPEVFVIYDQNAAKSIKAWSDDEHAGLARDDIERCQFDVTNGNAYWRAHWDDPRWYGGILLFYQKVWSCAQLMGKAEDLLAAAHALQAEVRNITGCRDAQITVCDLIDCHLWKSDGKADKPGLPT